MKTKRFKIFMISITILLIVIMITALIMGENQLKLIEESVIENEKEIELEMQLAPNVYRVFVDLSGIVGSTGPEEKITNLVLTLKLINVFNISDFISETSEYSIEPESYISHLFTVEGDYSIVNIIINSDSKVSVAIFPADTFYSSLGSYRYWENVGAGALGLFSIVLIVWLGYWIKRRRRSEDEMNENVVERSNDISYQIGDSKELPLPQHAPRSFLGKLQKYISVVFLPNNRNTNLRTHNQQVIKFTSEGTVSNYCSLTSNFYDVKTIDVSPCLLKQQHQPFSKNKIKCKRCKLSFTKMHRSTHEILPLRKYYIKIGRFNIVTKSPYLKKEYYTHEWLNIANGLTNDENLGNRDLLPQYESTYSPVILDNDEKLYWIDIAAYAEQKTVKEFKSSGSSSYYFKGYRASSGRSSTTTTRKVMDTSEIGKLMLTSKRIIYDSMVKVEDLKFSSIISIDFSSGYISIGIKNRKKKVLFIVPSIERWRSLYSIISIKIQPVVNDIKNCKSCGQQLLDDSNFCVACGTHQR